MAERLPRHFRALPDSAARGREAEDAAVAWLRQQGYQVVARNVRTPVGEIDAVAFEGATAGQLTLCFIEIKARFDTRFGGAIAAVGYRKQVRLARAARWFLARRTRWEGLCRFDVLGMEAAGAVWRFELVRDAFEDPGAGGLS